MVLSAALRGQTVSVTERIISLCRVVRDKIGCFFCKRWASIDGGGVENGVLLVCNAACLQYISPECTICYVNVRPIH